MDNHFILYELKGKSLAAIQDIEQLRLNKWISESMQWADHVGGPSSARLKIRFAQEADAQVKAEKQSSLRALGQHHAVKQVHVHPDTYARAYDAWPEIYASPTEPVRYFMYAPVGYNDDHFVPEDAEEITCPQKRSAIGNLLFAGGWLGNAPVISRTTTGAAMPYDFRPCSNRIDEEPHSADLKKKVFIAAGRSLHIVESHLKRKEEYDAAVNALFGALDDMLPDIWGADDAQAMEECYRPYMNKSLGQNQDGGKELKISIRSGQLGGQVLVFPENPHFYVARVHGNECVIKPRCDTKEGRKFGRIYDAVSAHRPDIGDYWQLHNPTAPDVKTAFQQAAGNVFKAPRLHSEGGVHYLVYNVARDERLDDYCMPPDSIPVNAAEFVWKDMDKRDRERGITPPPLPRELAYLDPRKKGTCRIEGC